ncbi:MAG: YesL family protein, partial [Anaerolineales bacterium]|nr:YesL family protein [Anaerolineales bacterium]
MYRKEMTGIESEKVTFRESLINIYYDLVPLVSLNIIWFLLTLPIVTAFPAAAGLYYATNQLAHQKGAGWKTFFDGFRIHFWLSWRWGLLNAIILIVLVSNIVFYGQLEAEWSVWLRGVIIGLSILWGIIQLYTFPFLLEQEKQRLSTALRNSMVLLATRPAPVLSVAFLSLMLAVLSTVIVLPAWFFFTASLSVYLANKVVIDSVKKLQKDEPP